MPHKLLVSHPEISQRGVMNQHSEKKSRINRSSYSLMLIINSIRGKSVVFLTVKDSVLLYLLFWLK